MMNPIFLAASLAVTLLLPGCASSPKHMDTVVTGASSPDLHPSRNPCGEFCSTIRSCADRAGHADLGPLLCKIARCETGNKCTGDIDSPTGLYQGPFQFVENTWNRQCTKIFERGGFTECLSGDAVHNTCCSTICATEMVATKGVRDWPHCGKKAKR